MLKHRKKLQKCRTNANSDRFNGYLDLITAFWKKDKINVAI